MDNAAYQKMAAARALDERTRLDAVLARATPIEGCGPLIPIAPARGPQVVVTPRRMVPDENDKTGWRSEETGWRGFKAVRVADVFDDLARRAAARGEAGPFTGRQVDVARLYRTLVERHDAGGVRCIGLETRVGGGASGGGEFIDAFIDAGRQIERFRQRIGSGIAMSVRRVRPSARGGATAGLILDRVLVDAICLQDKSFRRVLEDHGWAYKGAHAQVLINALGLSLNRMAGAVFKSS
ncbi:hypothetical protein [Paracoccus cavernae]